MTDRSIDEQALEKFTRGPDVWVKWDAARQLMAAKQMQSAANSQPFRTSFQELGNAASTKTGTDQLLSIALILRISELVKGELRKEADHMLRKALREPIEGIWTINDAKTLPVESKPSEIREDIASALSYATGPWLLPYIVEALAREEKSSRCRLELTRQLASHDKHLSHWFTMLSGVSWIDIVNSPDRTLRLRDIAIAMSTVIRENRNVLIVDHRSGPALARLMQALLGGSQHFGNRTRLIDAALAVIDLLDELIAVEFTFIADPEAYAPLSIVARWWQPSAYPLSVASRLEGVVRKLTSAIRLRARLGQKSESLVLRLRHALGTGNEAHTVLTNIAETETGLEPDIDDWLRGRERQGPNTAAAITSLLSKASTPMLGDAIAPLFLDTLDAMTAIAQNSDSALAAPLRRICQRIQALAAELKLRAVGTVGEIVEFNPAAHRTLSGVAPPELRVRLRRPMVVRVRDDSSQDVIERAIVEDI